MGFDEEIERIFDVKTAGTRLYDFADNVQLAITYELSSDLRVVKRQVYGLLDLLGDLGGLASSLYSLFFALITVFQYKAAVSYVTNHTFLVRKKASELTQKSNISDDDAE